MFFWGSKPFNFKGSVAAQTSNGEKQSDREQRKSDGEVCVLLSPSGCGKTATIKMINRLIEPTSGKIYIDGKDTAAVDTVQLRRSIGYVIQQIGLFPNKTIEDNICVVPDLMGRDRKASRRRAAELMEMVNLDPAVFGKRYPKELSGGQQQRIGVIRTLAADPPVLLKDELFGAIDPINREAERRESQGRLGGRPMDRSRKRSYPLSPDDRRCHRRAASARVRE